MSSSSANNANGMPNDGRAGDAEARTPRMHGGSLRRTSRSDRVPLSPIQIPSHAHGDQSHNAKRKAGNSIIDDSSNWNQRKRVNTSATRLSDVPQPDSSVPHAETSAAGLPDAPQVESTLPHPQRSDYECTTGGVDDKPIDLTMSDDDYSEVSGQKNTTSIAAASSLADADNPIDLFMTDDDQSEVSDHAKTTSIAAASSLADAPQPDSSTLPTETSAASLFMEETVTRPGGWSASILTTRIRVLFFLICLYNEISIIFDEEEFAAFYVAIERRGEVFVNYPYMGWSLLREMDGKTSLQGFVAMDGGGSIEIGGGIGVVTESCVLHKNRTDWPKQRVEQELMIMLGLNKIIWIKSGLMPDDMTDGHVDGLLKFVSLNTVLLHTTNETSDVNFNICQDAKRVLLDNGLKVIDLPLAKGHDMVHMNFYIGSGGDVAYVPICGDEEQDEPALEVIRTLYKTVVPIVATEIGKAGGGIHCYTQQIPR